MRSSIIAKKLIIIIVISIIDGKLIIKTNIVNKWDYGEQKL